MAAQHREVPKHQNARNLPGEANHISEDFSTYFFFYILKSKSSVVDLKD